MDLTPIVPAGRQVIDGYQPGRFRIAGVLHTGPVLVWPEATEPWPVADAATLTLADLDPVRQIDPPIDVLLIGCGARMALLPAALRQAMRASGIGVDAMDTGAACRTYNVLLSEGRRVAAALIPL